ncbi:MAG: PAS domain S-box protein [Nitrospirae bacterium]|nr:PAS domain S-box protein [Nitrospirota bacterium]
MNRKRGILSATGVALSLIIGATAFLYRHTVLAETEHFNLVQAALVRSAASTLKAELTAHISTMPPEVLGPLFGQILSHADMASPEGHICVLDRDGTFVHHTKYPELIGARLDEGIDPELRGRRFAYHRALEEDEGAVVADLPDRATGKGTRKQVLAWSSVRVGEQRWAVLFHTPYSAVVGRARRAFALQFVTSLLLMGTVLAAGGSLLRGERLAAVAHEQEVLRRGEERYRRLVEQAADAIFVVNNQGRILEANPAACDLLGYERDVLLNFNLREMFAFGKSRKQPLRVDELGTDEKVLFERALTKADGSIVLLELNAARLADGNIQIIARNIQERRRAEQEVRAAEAKYRTLVEQIPAVTYIASATEARRMIYVSPQIQPLLNFSMTEWMASPDLWDKRLHPEDRVRVASEVAQCHLSGKPFRSEYRLLAKDGQPVWFRDEGSVVRGEGGDPLFFQGFMLDISERKQAEIQALENLSLFRVLVDNLQSGVLVEDRARTIFAVNRAFCSLFSVPVPPERMLGANCEAAAEQHKALWADPERFPARIRELIESGRMVLAEELLFGDGRAFERDYIPIRTGEGVLVGHLWQYRDVSERRRAEEKLREKEEQWRAWVAAAPFEGVVIHEMGKVLDANQKLADMLGYDIRELIGKEMDELAPPESVALVLEKIRAGNEEPYRATARRKDGTIIPVEIYAKTVSYRGRTIRVGSVRELGKSGGRAAG